MPNRNNVIAFPASPVFAAPRKRGARSHTDLQANITSNFPLLMERTYADIKRMWKRQVPMGWIAKIHQLTIPQVEACIWVAYNASEVLATNETSAQDFAAVTRDQRVA